MPITPRFDVGYLVTANPKETAKMLLGLLTKLVEANLVYLRRFPKTPHPYAANIRYIREKPGEETWQGIGQILAKGGGDCEDLASYLAAYEQFHGVNATPLVLYKQLPQGHLFHIVVKYPDGRKEDPSKKLGMR